MIDCQNFLISSSGQKFRHPDKEAISRIIAFGSKSHKPHLHFNYVSDYNKIWNDRDLMRGDFPYQVTYAEETDDHLSIKL